MSEHSTTLREELNALSARQGQADAQIADIRRDIKQIRCDTREVVEMFRALSGGFKVLRWLGGLAVIITALITATTGAITVIKGWFK